MEVGEEIARFYSVCFVAFKLYGGQCQSYLDNSELTLKGLLTTT